MSNDPRGTMTRQGNLMQIHNGFVEEVSCLNHTNGYIIISYSVPEENDMTSIQSIRLNLSRNTAVTDISGQRISICCLRPGMWVNAVFSSRMTRSIPPQSSAYLIAVQPNAQLPQRPSSTTTGRIVLIDSDNRFFVTAGVNSDSEIRFNVSDTTSFTNRFGMPIRFRDLRPNQIVRVNHADFMTASIPPQTTAFDVRVM